MFSTELTPQVVRRFILGKMGLWPGRRWQGKDGAERAIRAMGALQYDPINVVGRSPDLALWGRVVDHQPGYLEQLAYDERRFFDYGELLYYYPMEELPYWRAIMRRNSEHPHYRRILETHAEAVAHVRAELDTRGAIANRDLAGLNRVSSYRARKDTGLALYCLWHMGELMTHGRRNAERLYGLAAHIAPPEHAGEVSAEEADHFMAHKAAHMMTLPTVGEWGGRFQHLADRPVAAAERKTRLAQLVESGALTPLKIAGRKGDQATRYLPTPDLQLLETLLNGGTPAEWQPWGATTHDEATFLAPLEMVSARGRAKALFDFDYVWEVYKPAPARRWGYYTLPVLYGDTLVARIDPKLDRKTNTLVLNGFWADDAALFQDAAFASAVGRGVGRLADFLGAATINAGAILPARFRQRLLRAARERLDEKEMIPTT